MKWLNSKIEKYVKWLETSGYGVKVGFKDQATTVVIPSEQYFTEYSLESQEEVEPLTEKEKQYLKVKCKNIVLDLVLKGRIQQQAAVKTLLAYYCEINDKVEKKKEAEKPTVVFKMGTITDAKPFITDENISFENEAIKKIKEEEGQ